MDNKEFGAYLRKLRQDKKLTIRQLEDLSKVSNGYISNFERGERGIPSPDILKKLAEPLGVDYETLMIKAGYWDERFDNDDRSRFEEIHNEEAEMLKKIGDLLKSLSDEDGVFPDYLHKDLYAIFGGWLPRQSDSQWNFDDDFSERDDDEISESYAADMHNEFNLAYNRKNIMNGLRQYNGFNKTLEDFLNELLELMAKHSLTVSLEDREEELGYPLEIELTEVLDTSSLNVIKYNNKVLSPKDRWKLIGMLQALSMNFDFGEEQ